MIKLEHLVRNYGTLCAVDDVSLEIRNGRGGRTAGTQRCRQIHDHEYPTGCLSSTSGRVIVQGLTCWLTRWAQKTDRIPAGTAAPVSRHDRGRVPRLQLRHQRRPTAPRAHLAGYARSCVSAMSAGVPPQPVQRGYRQRVGIAGALVGIADHHFRQPTVGLDPNRSSKSGPHPRTGTRPHGYPLHPYPAGGAGGVRRIVHHQ